ncbi:MAG: DGQHR domain-containing protein [Vicinamibacterales bacterium]
MSKKQTSDSSSKPHVGKVTHPIRVPAVKITQSGHALYTFGAKASTLFHSLSINRRIPDKDEGYQRVLSPSRVDAIKRYIKQGRVLPGAIIVSLDTAKFAKGELTIPQGTNVGWVIDGQHRLAGAELASRDGSEIELPVVAFVGLNDGDQVEQFITINREAKNVPTSLYLDLLHHLPKKSAADVARERATDIATQLRKDEESPFYERIVVTTAPKGGQISLVNFVRKIAPHVSPGKGILNTFTEREQLGVIANYFQGLRQTFPKQFDAKESIFFKTVGFGALWNVFPVFFGLVLQHHKAFTVKDVASVFKRIEDFDFSALNQYGSGEQAERTAADDIRTELLRAYQAPSNAPSALKLF